MKNLIMLTDSYKVTHYKQYPKGTECIYSYFESRGGQFSETKFFGLQYYLKEYLAGEVITKNDIDIAEGYFKAHFGNPEMFNRKGFEHIVNKHGGRLPVSIKAVPEGRLIPTHNVLMTIVNTDPQCFWLTNYLETLLVQVWYATTVATISHQIKKVILKFLQDTGDPSLINFKLHDFGFRGVSSVESAAIGGLAHLVNFMGSDTMAALVLADKYYGCPMAGFSIPASEHSTMTAWGKENESKAMANMLKQYPTGLMACVSDSYDIYNACTNIWGKELKDRVLARDGVLVVRPDSGRLPKIVLEVLDRLGRAFGSTVNEKGYKVLNPKVRVIQGDGCNLETCHDILAVMKIDGWSADNLAFGMGGGLLQKLDRDTQKFAFKCSAIRKDGKWEDVWKDPVTDAGKRSKPGRMKLVRNGNSYLTVPEERQDEDELVEVFRDGEILKEYSLEECRDNGKI